MGGRFEALSTIQEVHAAAQEAIADINISFRFARYSSVDFDDRIEELGLVGEPVVHKWESLEGIRPDEELDVPNVRSSTQVAPPPPPQPSFPERVIKAFGINENFREAVIAFNINPKNFKDLFIACEAVRKSFRHQKKISWYWLIVVGQHKMS